MTVGEDVATCARAGTGGQEGERVVTMTLELIRGVIQIGPCPAPVVEGGGAVGEFSSAITPLIGPVPVGILAVIGTGLGGGVSAMISVAGGDMNALAMGAPGVLIGRA